MKIRNTIVFLGLVFLAYTFGALASDDHGHDHGKDSHNEKPLVEDKATGGKEDDHDDHKEHKDEGENGHKEGEPDDHSGEGGHEEESTGGVGHDNAVTTANEEKGIQLAPKAVQAIGLQTTEISETKVPESALVFYQDKVGVYRLRDGWYRLIPLNRAVDGGGYALPGAEFLPGDRLVIAGAALLRVAELDAFSEEVGHEH